MKARSDIPNMFGININPVASELKRATKILGIAEDNRLDLIGVQDHPYNAKFLDAWTFLTHLATRTKRLRFISTVSDVPLRPPAMLAKAASTLDVLSDGRVELGIGAGAILSAVQSYGGALLSPKEAVSAFEEAIKVIRIVSGQEQRQGKADERGFFQGRFYHLDGVLPGPVHSRHRLRIWVGNNAGPRMLKIAGRLGDGWIAPLQSYLPTFRIKEAQQVIDDAARAAGRTPDSVRRLRLIAGVIDERGAMDKSLHGEGDLIVGTIHDWVDEILYYIKELGLESFIFWPYAKSEDMELEQAMLFVDKVVPEVKKYLGDN